MRRPAFLLACLLAAGVCLAADPAAKPLTADQALAELKAGNERFAKGKPSHPHVSLKRVKDTAAGQHPAAIILGCADSRVPPEVLFDEGIGDVFVVRVAGNVAEPATLGSIEYAAEHLHVPLVVVLGHHKCGAVQATCEQKGEPEGNIGAIVKEIQPAVVAAKTKPAREGLVNDAVHANAEQVAQQLQAKSAVLRHLVEEGQLKIATAVYDLDSGRVEWGN